MSRAESIRRKGGRIYYFQSGPAEEQNGRVSVHITAMITTPKRVSRSIHLRIPAEQYGYFLDTLQAQTLARFRHGRREYDRQTTLLRAFMQAGRI
ncbi:hypothetical protein KJZ67_05045 [Patescibacteria group bacterium]|nr:hypothetical protein [Patescibacteria group bacterium]